MNYWILSISILLLIAITFADENSTNSSVCDYANQRISATIINELRKLYDQANGTCPYPMVDTDVDLNEVYSGLPCGYECKPPVISEQNYIIFKIFSGILGLIIWIFSFITLLTIVINFPLLNRFIARPVIFLVLCNFAVFSTFIVQLFGLSDYVTCNPDGSLALNQPSNHIGCSIGFCIIYYFNMASICWIPCLCHACFIKAKNIKKTYSKSMHKWEIVYEIIYHVLSWSIPMILLIIVLVQRAVAGQNIIGFCYLQSSEDSLYYFRLPTLILVSLSLPLLVFTVIRLYSIQMYLRAMMKAAQSAKNCRELRNFLIKISIFIVISLAHLTIISMYGINDYDSTDNFLSRLAKHTCCELQNEISGHQVCEVTVHELFGNPDAQLAVSYIFIISLFLQHFLLTCWIWRWEFLIHWILCIRDPCGKSRGGVFFQQHYSQYDPSSIDSSKFKGGFNIQLKETKGVPYAVNQINGTPELFEKAANV
ncbi:hypothetical protein LOD99_4979 [Oopsacas minuta]|uniref:G-protein coupled receptors family 2 profile 2 domain-containing protein n=1 Tax=Oopsacas minuta TaxID=111878 RepID=A0AAV7JTJ2_9METZ|nr:hypothetical protein LOD99_4979 [Oopsacas minuta]